MRRMRTWAVGALCLGALAVSGCSAAGTLPTTNNDKSGKANFGITYDGNKGKLQGTYKDGNVSFSLNGYYDGGVPCYYPTYAPYKSTNPKMPGSGIVSISFCDEGEGSHSGGDWMEIQVGGGPFDGYSNSNYVLGNVQAK